MSLTPTPSPGRLLAPIRLDAVLVSEMQFQAKDFPERASEPLRAVPTRHGERFLANTLERIDHSVEMPKFPVDNYLCWYQK